MYTSQNVQFRGKEGEGRYKGRGGLEESWRGEDRRIKGKGEGKEDWMGKGGQEEKVGLEREEIGRVKEERRRESGRREE